MFGITNTAEQRAEAERHALVRMVHMLLHVVATRSIRGSPAEYDRFHATLMDIEAELGVRPTAERVLILAGSASKAIEDYNYAASRFLDAGRHQAAAPLIDFIASVSRAPAPLIDRLRAAAPGPATEQCLNDVRAVIRQEDPPRVEAEAALAGAMRAGHCFATAIAIERLPFIAARWGAALAAEVTETCAAEFRRYLTPADHVLEWGEGLFVFILNRRSALPAPRRLERTFESAGRSVLLTISTASCSWPLDSAEPLNQVVRKINAFLAPHFL